MDGQTIGFQFQESSQQAQVTGARRAALDTALKAAAKLYTHAEYLELERDVTAGKVDVRVYDEGLVLMRTGG
ncbi:MAG: hypothetical protein ACKVP3_06620 [Hyphomicrobiaceae bacterium]